MNACEQFRARLASLLSGRVKAETFGRLVWHEHLLACGDCRALLDAEHALEVLLASLPEPHLPPELARRVLSRLEPARADVALDRLLEDSLAVPVPAELARRVLDRLAVTRRAAAGRSPQAVEAELDALLERVPAPVAPAGLTARVLSRLASERPSLVVRAARAHLRVVRAAPRRRRILIAASILTAVGLGAWAWSEVGGRALDPRTDDGLVDRDPAPGGVTPQSSPPSLLDEPPADLLASLDLLESWEFVTDDSLETELVLEGYDVLLFDGDAVEGEPEATTQPEQPRNG